MFLIIFSLFLLLKIKIVLHYVIYLIGGLMLLSTKVFTYCQFVIDFIYFLSGRKRKREDERDRREKRGGRGRGRRGRGRGGGRGGRGGRGRGQMTFNINYYCN